MSILKPLRDIKYGIKYDLVVGYVNEVRANKNVIRVTANSMVLNDLYKVYQNKKSYILAHYEPDNRIKTGAVVLVKRKPPHQLNYTQRFFIDGLVDDYNAWAENRMSACGKVEISKISSNNQITCPISFPSTPAWLKTQSVDVRPEFYENNQVDYFLLKILEETVDEISQNYSPPVFVKETSIAVENTLLTAKKEKF